MVRAKNESAIQEEELKEVIVSIKRVAKVVKGGRRFSISVLAVVGDGKGRVGFGLGKDKEVTGARSKAVKDAKKAMKRIYLREGRTLHHDVEGSFGSGKVILRAAKPGTGIIAGGSMRSVLEALGIQDVVAKSLKSTNVHNMVRATMDALQKVRSPRHVAEKRGKKTSDIIGSREITEK